MVRPMKPDCHPTQRVAALVLGAAVCPDGTPTPALLRRAHHGAALYLAGKVQLVIGCGGVGDHGPAEALVIAELCRQAGVPDSAIRCERQSKTTLENIAFARPLLEAAGIPRVVLVTDAYHAPRARMIARRLGLCATSASPKAPGMRKRLRWSLREIPAYLYYRFWPGALDRISERP